MRNMFKCVLASGTGNGIPLIVTCASDFAGLTITCTDGTTTLTDTCPSSAPYEITFNLPNTGTWTVSGTVSGVPYSESIVVQDFNVELKNNIDLVVDFYSAANDTVSYTGAIDGQTHTITTDSSGHASATITIDGNGSSITFTSSVAKNPDSLSGDYTKTIALTRNMTEVYFMPDNALYWYGYNNVETMSSANGWTLSKTATNPSYGTNKIAINAASSQFCGVASKTPITGIVKEHTIIQGVSGGSNIYCSLTVWTGKNNNNYEATQNITNTTLQHSVLTVNNSGYVSVCNDNSRQADLYALWYE